MESLNKISNREAIEKSVAGLKELMAFSEEIPEYIIHGHGAGDFKVRGKWFLAIISTMKATLRHLSDSGFPNTRLKDEIKGFEKAWRDRRAENARNGGSGSTIRTTREEIDKGNELVTKVLRFCEDLGI